MPLLRYRCFHIDTLMPLFVFDYYVYAIFRRQPLMLCFRYAIFLAADTPLMPPPLFACRHAAFDDAFSPLI